MSRFLASLAEPGPVVVVLVVVVVVVVIVVVVAVVVFVAVVVENAVENAVVKLSYRRIDVKLVTRRRGDYRGKDA